MPISIAEKVYPLTARFEAEVCGQHPDLTSMSYHGLEAARDALMVTADRRARFQEATPALPLAPCGTLTILEYGRLEAITHVINVHHGVRFLQGRDHADFGFEGVDQVHGNVHHLECGCALHIVFDHHRRGEDGLTLHPHYPRRSCDAHAHLLPDFGAHHAQAIADAQES